MVVRLAKSMSSVIDSLNCASVRLVKVGRIGNIEPIFTARAVKVPMSSFLMGIRMVTPVPVAAVLSRTAALPIPVSSRKNE